jgi:hypothetical protein
MHAGRVADLTGYTPETPLPTIFGDPPTDAHGNVAEPEPQAGKPSTGPDDDAPAITLAEDPVDAAAQLDTFRDDLLNQGFGPGLAPGGLALPPNRDPDYTFTTLPWPGSPCWTIDGAIWCFGNGWGTVAIRNGDRWAAAPLNGAQACSFETHWADDPDDGTHRFGGMFHCADGTSNSWHVVEY